MLDQAIDKVKVELEEVDEKLQDPQVIENQKKLKEYSQKRARLDKILKLADKMYSTKEDLEEYKKMLKETDEEELKQSLEEEVRHLEKKIPELEEQLKMTLVPPAPEDSKNAIIEIRAASGGEEAALFAKDLYRMYGRFCEKYGYEVDVANSTISDSGGFKEISFTISSGENPYGYFKYEGGIHRVQRIPKTETQGRIHTSAVSVVIIPEKSEEIEVNIDPSDLKMDTFRASGAGGQHVNKTESAVRITHEPTGVVVECQDERSQKKNREKALRILYSKIYQQQLEEKKKEEASARKSMVKSGDRSEKIRTYNFPQNRVTDHRINLTLYDLENIMEGHLDELLNSLKRVEYEQFLKSY